MEQENRLAGQKNYKNYHHISSEESFTEIKKKTSTSKILKSLVDAPFYPRTIRRHLNNEKN